MSLASAAGILLKPQTPLQQLLEDINFQRTKEMRQLLKDGNYYVININYNSLASALKQPR